MTFKHSKDLKPLLLTMVLAVILSACLPGTPRATATNPPTVGAPTLTQPAVPPTTAPTATIPPSPVPPTTPPPTAGPTATNPPGVTPPAPSPTVAPPTATVAAGASLPVYLDDRSTPTGLILSYFNAINRKEYLRAYSYYSTPSQTVGTFVTFSAGYANTASVAVTLGAISGDNGAGQIYYTVRALLKSVSTGNATTTYAACYILHLSQPGVQGAPPFAPLSINLGKASVVNNNADPTTALANACSGPDFPQGGQPINPAPQTNLQDISKNNYLDERSEAKNVVKSLLNAINRKEYVRAYSYWQAPATAPGPFAAYQQGFATTDRVEATFGAVTGDAGAGQLYYKVPVAEKVYSTAGSTQTFVGCYTLHISQPAIQGEPPFMPLGIIKGSLTLVANNANTQALLATACAQP